MNKSFAGFFCPFTCKKRKPLLHEEVAFTLLTKYKQIMRMQQQSNKLSTSVYLFASL